MEGTLRRPGTRGFWRAAVALTAWLALLGSAAHALDPARKITQLIQTSWTSESGLPQNSVHAIAQTTDGYLWLGTEEGLARFDGEHFVVFSRENSDDLASDYIQALAAGSDGKLWIGTDSGLNLYEPAVAGAAEGTLRTIAGFSGKSITALCTDRDGGLWVGTSGGLERTAGDRIEDWTTSTGLGNATVNAIVLDTKGTLWVGTDTGVSYLDHGRFVALSAREGLPGSVVTSLAAAGDGSVWAGTLGHGVAQLRRGQASVPSTAPPWKEVDGVLASHDGAVWVSFDRHGIGRYYEGKWEIYGTAQGLPSDRCTRALFQDREGSLWVGLLDAGVVQLRSGKFAVFGKPEGLSGNYVGNVLQAKDGTMWIGADSNGLDHVLPGGRIEVWDDRRGLPNEAVYSLLQARDGSLWVGYRRGALARIHDGRVSIYHDSQARDASLNALFEDREGRLWVGFFGKGLAQLEDGAFRHVSLTWRVSNVTQTADGAVWVATDGDGVQRLFDGRTQEFSTANGLPSDHAMYVYADSEGNVWVGTASGGLSRIRDGRVVSWKVKQGLPASTVGSILEDNRGNLWMGSDNGIFRIAKQELMGGPGTVHPVLYGTADGLRSRETLYGSMPCAWKDRDGKLWFATILGAAVIDPAHIAVDAIAPPVWIEGVTFDGHPIRMENGVRLWRGTGKLQVNFTAPSFVAPQGVRFRYRLTPFEDGWTEAGARRTAWYTNLPPGSYRFEVQAENSDGVWNRRGAAFSFVLTPPLVRTPEAYVAYGLVALLLAWIVIAFRTRHLMRRQQELTRTVAERTAQLESEKTALEAARRALQIQATHDSLTGLYNRGAMLEHLAREIARARREDTTLGVVIADLDHFKRVNDQYGHVCGDDIIREAAERFRAATRGYDIVGRYGGEEFLILLPAFDFQLSPDRIEDLLDAIRSHAFQAGETEIRLTCSLGVGTFRPALDSTDTLDLIRRADTALYVAKNLGRNQASFEVRETHVTSLTPPSQHDEE